MSLLKPVKGCDHFTRQCLRSWFAQVYPGPVQVLFGVASAEDPACEVIRSLLSEFPEADAELVVCGPPTGANAKVSKLAQLAERAKHEFIVVSDADVCVPPDFLENLAPKLEDSSIGLVNCFYQLARPATFAMQWEAVAINADFWSQVLQSNSLKRMDFALGAVMATRRKQLREIGGFEALKECLADDYQLGHRIARRGFRIEILPLVVECWSEPQGWKEVWKHQLRWARTIRVCQPGPYFMSILSNATLWPLLWFAVYPGTWSAAAAVLFCGFRLFMSRDLQRRLARKSPAPRWFWMPWLKDFLQAAIWICAFAGDTIEWRGERMRLKPDGTLARQNTKAAR